MHPFCIHCNAEPPAGQDGFYADGNRKYVSAWGPAAEGCGVVAGRVGVEHDVREEELGLRGDTLPTRHKSGVNWTFIRCKAGMHRAAAMPCCIRSAFGEAIDSVA
jgi:hypothetical protein